MKSLFIIFILDFFLTFAYGQHKQSQYNSQAIGSLNKQLEKQDVKPKGKNG